MKELRKYLFNAYYSWLVDSGKIPYVVVRANTANCSVPMSHVNQLGFITLNLAMDAVQNFAVTESGVSFLARFNKVSTPIIVPFGAMVMIHAKDGSCGMDLSDQFADEEGVVLPEHLEVAEKVETLPEAPPKKRNHLTVVK